MLNYCVKRKENATKIRKGIQELDLKETDILTRYQGQHFAEGPPKYSVFCQVLFGKPSEETLNYFQDRLSHKSLDQHRGENRTPVQYGADLILSWLFEDAVLVALNNRNLFCELTGNDKDRDFLMANNVSATADMVVGPNRKALELVLDYTGWWNSGKPWDARNNKWERAMDKDYLVLGVDLVNLKSFIIKASDHSNYTKEKIDHPRYNKSAISVEVKEMLKPLPEVIEQLCDLSLLP